MLEEARGVELGERLASLQRGHHDPPALLRMATASGHASLGWPDAGRFEAGALADLTTIGLDSVRLAGTSAADAVAGAVFAATATDVRHVVVGGRVVVRDGQHVAMDVAAELREALA
jgi:cytosine/adenosine deaminase-related metal-dependent hydrolase